MSTWDKFLDSLYRMFYGYPGLHRFGTTWPTLGKGCYIAPTASVVGNVVLGDQCSVWFGAVVRGDGGPIKLGSRVNVQDGVVIHCLKGGSVTIGDDVSLGHNCTIHGCDIESGVLVGVGAVVMDGVLLKSGCVIAAGAVLPPGVVCGQGLYMGVPARRHDITPDVAGMIEVTSGRYVDLIARYTMPPGTTPDYTE